MEFFSNFVEYVMVKKTVVTFIDTGGNDGDNDESETLKLRNSWWFPLLKSEMKALNKMVFLRFYYS